MKARFRPRVGRWLSGWAFLLLGGSGVNDSLAGMMTVDFTAQPGQRFVADVRGEAVPAGVHVAVGALAGPLPQQISCAAVGVLWQPFAETLTRSLASQAGRFSAAAARDRPEFSQQKIYLLIRQTAGGEVPRADASNVLAWGLYSSHEAAWLFPDAEALAPGNATLITSSEVDEAWGGQVSARALELGLVPPTAAAAYATWAGECFAEVGSVGAGPLADPDQDGLANAWECLYGTSPWKANASPLAVIPGAQGIGLSFPRNAMLPAGYEQVEMSSTLTSWVVPEGDSFSMFGEAGAVRYYFPRAARGPRLFLRLVLPWLR